MEVEFLVEGGSRKVSSTGSVHSKPLSRVDKAFGHQETKDCMVVLHRLDEKLIRRYLRRGKDSERKRRKVRPLCYTDDEDDPVEAKPLRNCPENDRSAQVDLQEMEIIKQKPKEMGCELMGMVEQTKEELPVESGNSPSGGAGHCSVVDNEIEIINEFPRSFRGNVIRDKDICDVITQDDSVNDLDDSREDEDDKSTVIFEKDTFLEELTELEEKEISSKFKKKKITNRKKQRLVKFKRKSMNGRNLGKIRKSKGKGKDKKERKNKLFESGSGGLDAAEKSVSDCVAEDSLREVCISVRRLHEMYTIILQLQKEMPKDTELSYHFKRVINAQRENFHREIRKSQKIIIKSFEKMLKPPNNTLDKVALDIGKRTFLTADEVIYVLSLCILSEGSYDMDKSRSGSVEKPEQPKPSQSSLRKHRITKKAAQAKSWNVQPKEVANTEVPTAAPPLHTSIPPVTVTDHPVEEGSRQSQAPVAFIPTSRGQVPRACPQPFTSYRLEKPNQRSHYWAQQNYESAQINNSGVGQFREVQVVRQSAPSTNLPGTVSQYCNIPHTNQNALYPLGPRPPSVLYTLLQHSQRDGNLPPVEGRTLEVPVRLPSQRQCNYVPDKPNPNQTFGSPVLVQNTLGFGAVPNRITESNQPIIMNSVPSITQRRGVFLSLENLPCNGGNGEIVLSSQNESQCHLDFTCPIECYTASPEKPVHERLTVPVEAECSNTETNPKTDSEVSEVLDPTIPQKLTMKNCRLQAGPILDRVKSSEEKTKSSAVKSPDKEHSRSRTYICAEDDCKNPGVGICTSCRSVIYCSRTCQQKHWNLKHKSECCQLKELRG